jgi:hypothetical protein
MMKVHFWGPVTPKRRFLFLALFQNMRKRVVFVGNVGASAHAKNGSPWLAPAQSLAISPCIVQWCFLSINNTCGHAEAAAHAIAPSIVAFLVMMQFDLH